MEENGWISKHWKLLLGVTIGVAVVGGSVVYLKETSSVGGRKKNSSKSTDSQATGQEGSASKAANPSSANKGKDEEEQSPETKKKSKGKKKKTASTTSTSPSSSSKLEGATAEEEVKPSFSSPTAPSPVSSSAHVVNTDEKTPEEKTTEDLAFQAKTDGNKLYSAKNYAEAIERYSEAIRLAPNAIYYCNRAACYSNLKDYQNAIADCNEAIKLDPKYIKAFHRRALAYEALEDFRSALNEYTAVCALEGFRNQNTMAAPDRLLKVISAQRTKEIMETKVHTMPSETFISAYMVSFRTTPTDATIVLALETDNESDIFLKETFTLANDRKWQQAYDACEKAIVADSFSSDFIKAKALNFRGTLRFLMGIVDEAVEDLENSLLLDENNINTMIKRATLHMERGEIEKTIEQFAKAEKIAPSHPDLFYHRGQVRFLTGDFPGAVEDYSVSLKSEGPGEGSVYVHIQMGVALYKQGDISGAEKKFRECKQKFPDSAEVWNYHGEILMDKQTYAEAQKSFDKSIEMDPNSPLPYINKAILHLQWKQDSDAAEIQCRKAMEVDPLCDIAYTQLAQLLCMQNKLDEAITIYDKAISIARTEAEVMNVVSCQEAAQAQQYVVLNFPDSIQQD